MRSESEKEKKHWMFKNQNRNHANITHLYPCLHSLLSSDICSILAPGSCLHLSESEVSTLGTTWDQVPTLGMVRYLLYMVTHKGWHCKDNLKLQQIWGFLGHIKSDALSLYNLLMPSF